MRTLFCVFIVTGTLAAAWALPAARAQTATPEGDTILLDDDFGQLPPGMFSGGEVGAHAEYHYLPELTPKGNWAVACFANGSRPQRWRACCAREVFRPCARSTRWTVRSRKATRCWSPPASTARCGAITRFRSVLRRSRRSVKVASPSATTTIAAITFSAWWGRKPC